MEKVVGVKFSGTYSTYAFKTDLDLKVDDLVVCDTSRGYSVGKVAGGTDVSKATKWIVQKVDVAAFEARKAKEAELEKMLRKMETRRKKVESLSLYRSLAKDDPIMADYVRAYDTLKAGTTDTSVIVDNDGLVHDCSTVYDSDGKKIGTYRKED